MIIQQRGELKGVSFLVNYDTDDDEAAVEAIAEDQACGLITWREASYCFYLVYKARVQWRKMLRKAGNNGRV